MVRETSIEAFRQIEEEGLLSDRRFQVYSYLFRHGPCTGLQVSGGVPGGWKRLAELRDLGVAREVGYTVCEVTGKTVLLWDVTDKLPDPNGLKPSPEPVQKTLF